MGQTSSNLEIVQLHQATFGMHYPPEFAVFCKRYHQQSRDGWDIRCAGDSHCYKRPVEISETNGMEECTVYIDCAGSTSKSACIDIRYYESLCTLMEGLWKEYLASGPTQTSVSKSCYYDEKGESHVITGLCFCTVYSHPYRISYPPKFAKWCADNYDEKTVEGIHIIAGSQYHKAIIDDKLYLDERGSTSDVSNCDDIEPFKKVLTKLWGEYKESCPVTPAENTVLRME